MTDFKLQSTVGMVKFFKCMQKDKFILNTYFDFKLKLGCNRSLFGYNSYNSGMLMKRFQMN